MKSLKEILLESSGWEPDIMKTHRDAYNSFIKLNSPIDALKNRIGITTNK